jgi:hypothetical protein
VCKTAPKRDAIKLMKCCDHHFITVNTRSKLYGTQGEMKDDFKTFCCVCGITPDRLRKWTKRKLRKL